MGPVGLRSIKLARSGLKECGTCRLQVPLEHAPVVAQENPEGLPERVLGPSTFNKEGKRAASSPKTRRAKVAELPRPEAHIHPERAGGVPRSNAPRGGRDTPLAAPCLNSTYACRR